MLVIIGIVQAYTYFVYTYFAALFEVEEKGCHPLHIGVRDASMTSMCAHVDFPWRRKPLVVQALAAVMMLLDVVAHL